MLTEKERDAILYAIDFINDKVDDYDSEDKKSRYHRLNNCLNVLCDLIDRDKE